VHYVHKNGYAIFMANSEWKIADFLKAKGGNLKAES